MSIANLLSPSFKPFIIYSNNRNASDTSGNTMKYEYSGNVNVTTSNVTVLSFVTQNNKNYLITYFICMFSSPDSVDHPLGNHSQFSVSSAINTAGTLTITTLQIPNYYETNAIGVTGQLFSVTNNNTLNLIIKKDSGANLNIWNATWYAKIVASI
jgi:hypothetical protein